jgi:hypothetical protein
VQLACTRQKQYYPTNHLDHTGYVFDMTIYRELWKMKLVVTLCSQSARGFFFFELHVDILSEFFLNNTNILIKCMNSARFQKS